MRTLPAALLLLSAALLPSCGSDDDDPTSPTGPSQATITVTQSAQGQVCFSPVAGFTGRARVPVRIAESAGVGASINFVRLSLLRGGVEVERREITSSGVTSGLGTNRIAANQTVTATLSFDFNTTDFTSFRVDFNFTDDRGTALQATLMALDVVAAATCTI
jgi:hypothetical protein